MPGTISPQILVRTSLLQRVTSKWNGPEFHARARAAFASSSQWDAAGTPQMQATSAMTSRRNSVSPILGRHGVFGHNLCQAGFRLNFDYGKIET
jgi:hypothetical protein